MMRYFLLVTGVALLIWFYFDFVEYQTNSAIYAEVEQYEEVVVVKPISVDSTSSSLVPSHRGGGAGNQYYVIFKMVFQLGTGRILNASTSAWYDGNKHEYRGSHDPRNGTFRVHFFPSELEMKVGNPEAYKIEWIQSDGHVYNLKSKPRYDYFDPPKPLGYSQLIFGILLTLWGIWILFSSNKKKG